MKHTVKAKFLICHRHWRHLVLAGSVLALAGCSSNLNTLGDPTGPGPAPISQARNEAPGTPPPAFPPVHDIPAPRNSVILSDYEQRRLENDLAAARRKVSPDPVKPAAKAGAKSTDKAAAKPADKPAAPQNAGVKQDP